MRTNTRVTEHSKDYTSDGHVGHLASAYVLELLPDSERKLISTHIAHCQDCQAAVRSERQIGMIVRDTLAAATRDQSPDFRQLMPGPPSRFIPSLGINWRFRVVLVGLLLLLILGGIGLQYDFYQYEFLPGIATAYSTSVAATDTPGITSTALDSDGIPTPTEYVLRPTPKAHFAITAPRPAIAPVPAAPLLH